jgi:hypothetical protein
MCEHTTGAANGNAAAQAAMKKAGSRRRRLWELPSHAFCPVMGVCLPINALRSLVDKALGEPVKADDYELHCCVIAECKSRTPMAERLQRELDRRYQSAQRQAAQAKTTDALSQWWSSCQHGNEIAGALWSVLTHPRCDVALEERVLSNMHMMQHQLGAAHRADVQRFAALIEENGVLTRELGAAQHRSTRVITEKNMCIERQAADLMQLRAALIGKDTALISLREEIATLEAGFPGLRTRVEQARHIEAQLARIHDLERQLLREQQRSQSLQDKVADLTALQPASAAGNPMQAEQRLHAADGLRDKSVLCVGGRPGIVPIYRQLIERTGGHFLHHDGGEEESAARLDASLAAADLVICQTGCVSHGAYWRVKDHCKRTGKRCVFVEKPSVSSMARCLKGIEQSLPECNDTAAETINREGVRQD